MSWSAPATLLAGPHGEKTGLTSRVTEISEFGVRITTTIPLLPGQQVDVIPVDGPQFPLECRVVWVGRPDTPEYGQAGLEFLSPIPLTMWGPIPKRAPAPVLDPVPVKA
jgi:PilZ domain-containing protein